MAGAEKILIGTTRKGNAVYLPPKTRTTHMHILGASGRGKSTFLEHLIREDIRQGNGLCLIDPHGYLYEDLVRWIETHGFAERRQIQLLEPSFEGWTFGFNPLDFGAATPDELFFCVDAMVKVCAQVWGGEDTSKTPLLKRVLRSVLYALAAKRLTLLEALELTSPESGEVRCHLTRDLPDYVFAAQWQMFNTLRPMEFDEKFGSANNRIIEFLAAEIIRNIIGQQERVINFRQAMDGGHIILVNLASRGRLSDDNARLLGALMVNDLFLKARRRGQNSRSFYLYLDECSLFVNEDIARILDEAGKFGLHLILAHQHLNQLKAAGEKVYSAVMTNAQTKVIFGGLSVEDAEIMAQTVYMGEYDLEEKKGRYDAPRVVGYVKTWLRNNSEISGFSHGTHQSSGESASASQADYEGAPVYSSSGSSFAHGESSGYSESQSSGVSEALVPQIEWGPTQGYSLEEQIYRSMALMVNQETQQAIAKLPVQRTRQVRTPDIAPGIARDERIVQLRQRLFKTTPFASPVEEVRRTLEARRGDLLRSVRSASTPRKPSSFRE